MECQLPVGFRLDLMPKHVAVIMDGNSRWAQGRGLPTAAGHQAGVQALREMIICCQKWRIRVLTVFAFSSENWHRSKVEVDILMALLEKGIKDLMREDLRIRVIGDTSKLSSSLQEVVKTAEEKTKKNQRLDVLLAVSYGGQDDLLQACRKIAQKVRDGQLEPSQITAATIDQELATNCAAHRDPDLLIRTGGEQRVSNFLLWQSAYTELFFSKTHWPDFREEDFAEAIRAYQSRQRRFGLRVPEK